MPTQVGYISGPLSIDHGQLLDSEASYTPAVNKVIDAHFPHDLATGVCQYQHYNETRYSIQKTIRELQAKEMRYLERAVEVLSELECANVIGHLLAIGSGSHAIDHAKECDAYQSLTCGVV